MLNFDEDRFLLNESCAVTCGVELRDVIRECLDRAADSLFFLGAGGAGILMWPAAELLARRSRLLTVCDAPASLVASGSVHLTSRSIVVLPSRSGDTAESLEALEYSKRAGATVIALIGTPGSQLAERADYTFTNQVGDDNSSESFYIQSLLIALAVMDALGEFTGYEEVLDEFRRLPEVMLQAKRSFDPIAKEIAVTIANTPYQMIVGAGSTWPEAMYYGMCILEEMQWVRTRPVHAADFFHGPLELIEPGVSCMLLKGADASRPLVERVEQFLAKYGDAPTVLDAAAIGSGISDRLRSMVSPVLLATVLERVSSHLEVLRDHPLTTRRYYRQVAY